MSVIQELGATPTDFLRDQQGGYHVRMKPGGTVIISPRLRNELQGYAERYAIPFSTALERLNNEINSAGWK